MLQVLERAADDITFYGQLAEDPQAALKVMTSLGKRGLLLLVETCGLLSPALVESWMKS